MRMGWLATIDWPFDLWSGKALACPTGAPVIGWSLLKLSSLHYFPHLCRMHSSNHISSQLPSIPQPLHAQPSPLWAKKRSAIKPRRWPNLNCEHLAHILREIAPLFACYSVITVCNNPAHWSETQEGHISLVFTPAELQNYEGLLSRSTQASKLVFARRTATTSS